MIGDNPKCYILLLIISIILTAQFGGILDNKLKNIGIVIAWFSLNSAHQSLEAHAGIHVLGWQTIQATIGFAVEFHEHQVPDFNHFGMILID